MADLAQLDSCRRTSLMLQAKLSQISTPLHVEAWSKILNIWDVIQTKRMPGTS